MQRITIAPHQIQTNQLILTGDQQHYLCRVLRLEPGQQFYALDGQGTIYLAQLESSSAVILGRLEVPSCELPVIVNLILAMPKQGLDDVIRACTELGVSNIHLVTSDRTIPAPSNQKLHRWQKIAQEAAEQCERLVVPTIHSPQPWLQFSTQPSGQKFIGVTRQSAPHFMTCSFTNHPIWIAIGPEGGWTDRELTQVVAEGWQPVSLGSRILRSITAPMAAMVIVSSHLES